MIHYNKLIRDKLPENKAKDGQEIKFHVAMNDEEYWHKLLEKLQAEINKFAHEFDQDTITDVLEVLDAMMVFKQIDEKEMWALKENKKIELGGFERRLVLEGSEEEIGHRQEQPL